MSNKTPNIGDPSNPSRETPQIDESYEPTVNQPQMERDKPPMPTSVSRTKAANTKKRLAKPQSFVWDHFTKVLNASGGMHEKATCNYCHKEYYCPSTYGTSTLTTHLNKCTKFSYNANKKQKTLAFQPKGPDGESSLVVHKFDQELCREALAKMIILDELPFKQVEREGFRYFVSVVQPKFKLVSRITIAKECLAIYGMEMSKLKSFLNRSVQRVSLTTDTWTSLQNINYMCLTAHFVDSDWKLHKRIHNFCVISSHKGTEIEKAIEKCLLQWGIDKVVTITVDNASANDTTCKYLRKKINNWNGCVLGGEYLHMRCTAHILNLIVKDGLSDMHDSISRIRDSVRYVRSSPSRLQKFKNCVELEKIESKSLLCLDVPTRWNSTYLMLDTAMKFQKAFARLEELDPFYITELQHGTPNEEDWEIASVLTKFLQIFYDATNHLSGSLYVTANAYFHEVCTIEAVLIEWSESNDPRLSSIAKTMKTKYDKYWGSFDKMNLLLLIAVVLDARYKLKYVKYCYSNMYPTEVVADMIEKVKLKLNELYNQYSMLHGNSSSITTQSSSQTEVDQQSGDSCAQSQMLKIRSGFHKFLEEEDDIGTKSEVDRYLEESVVKEGENFDILNWWKVNSSKCRILSLVAQDVLAIPVSTVASESAFSTGGRVLDQFHSSLTPKLVEALICAQDWLRASPIPFIAEETLEDLEDIESGTIEDMNLAAIGP